MQRSIGALPRLEMRHISLLKRSSGVSAARTLPEGSREGEPGCLHEQAERGWFHCYC